MKGEVASRYKSLGWGGGGGGGSAGENGTLQILVQYGL